MSKDNKNKEFVTNSLKIAVRMSSILKTKDDDLLPIVKFNKKGLGFYYSISDKTFVQINKEEEWYLVTYMPKDEQGRVVLYSPYLFSMAIFIKVPEEEISLIGFN